MSTAEMPAINMDKLNTFIGQFVNDLGAAVHAGMVVIGEKLGLYKALAGGPMTPAQLASRTQTDERYVREWLSSQAAGSTGPSAGQSRRLPAAAMTSTPWEAAYRRAL